MKNRILICLVISQVILIAIISYSIFLVKNEKKVSVSPIERGVQIFPKVYGLKYFYEPKPDNIEKLNPQLSSALGYPPGFEVKYKINKDGQNQIHYFKPKKTDKAFRIVTLGDSYTFGQYVNTKDNYPSQLQKLLNNKCKEDFQVINLGVGGYDIRYIVARYKLRGDKYDPDLVLWFMIGDDLRRINELQRPILQELVKKIKSQGPQEVIEDLIAKNSWIESQHRVIERIGGEDKILEHQSKYLLELNKIYNGKLVMFHFYSLGAESRDLLSEFIESREDSYLFDIPELNTLSERLFDNHPNAAGYTKVTENVFRYLTNNKLIPCN